LSATRPTAKSKELLQAGPRSLCGAALGRGVRRRSRAARREPPVQCLICRRRCRQDDRVPAGGV